MFAENWVWIADSASLQHCPARPCYNQKTLCKLVISPRM